MIRFAAFDQLSDDLHIQAAGLHVHVVDSVTNAVTEWFAKGQIGDPQAGTNYFGHPGKIAGLIRQQSEKRTEGAGGKPCILL